MQRVVRPQPLFDTRVSQMGLLALTHGDQTAEVCSDPARSNPVHPDVGGKLGCQLSDQPHHGML
jgi:hypothetical protein